MLRRFTYNILEEIKQRWSPRAFSTEPIPAEKLNAALEAAHYAPSCFNEQPWRFMVAQDDQTLKQFRTFLAAKNQLWANSAPVLIIFLVQKFYSFNKKLNNWSQFDTGAAWGYFSLEAQHQGLITHGMAGFDKEKARTELKIPDDLEIIMMAAVGSKRDEKNLPLEFKDFELPGQRKPLAEVLLAADHFIK